MSLLRLIQKGGLNKVATATIATPATQEPEKPGTVATVAGIAVASPQKQGTPKTGDERSELRLEHRLVAAGISIAIDRATGSASLVFSQSDAEAVKDVATVYRADNVTLTPEQRQELENDLNYYERLMTKKQMRNGGA
jgi:hypothetical protein